MADITRPDYGVVWANAGEKIAPEPVKMDLGWVQEMMPFQYENWLQARQDEAITYILQKGIAEYSTTQDYIANKSLALYQGAVYLATQNNTNVLPTVQANWKRISTISNNDGVVSVSGGGTGATTPEQARLNLGLGTAAVLDAAFVVQKDDQGNFTAGTITASLNGTATSAQKLATARSITLTGAVTSTATMFDGSANVTVVTTSVNAANITGQIPSTSLGNAVTKTSATGSAELPSGTTSERDVVTKEGYLRYNKTLKLLEYWNGTAWIVPNGTDLGSLVGTGPGQISNNAMLDSTVVKKTSTTGAALLPEGNDVQRPVDGSIPADIAAVRGNTQTPGNYFIEYWNRGVAAWQALASQSWVTSITNALATRISTIEGWKRITPSQGDAPYYGCRAWVNFNGVTNPPQIRGSGNISSITDHGSGDYTVNLIYPMADAGYAISIGLGRLENGVGNSNRFLLVSEVGLSSFRLKGTFSPDGNADIPYCAASIFR